MSLNKNLGLKALALFLSVFVWLFVRFTQTPFATTINQADVQVPLEVLSDPDKVALDAPQQVTVTVRGSRDAITGLQHNAITARIDLRDKQRGIVFPAVAVTTPPDITVVAVEDERPSIRLELLKTQSLPVEVKLSGRPAQGYATSVPTVQPLTVDVSGPANFVNGVRHVFAVVDVSKMDVSIVQRVALQAFDEGDKVVSRVEIVPANAMVSVNVQPEILPKVLPIFPDIQGTPRSGLTVQARWTPRLAPVVFKRPKDADVAALYTTPVIIDQLGPGQHEIAAALLAPPNATIVNIKDVKVIVTLKEKKKQK